MIDLLRSFQVVLEEGSLNRAAKRLHLTQPSLTRQMQMLETTIGGPLLERQTSGVKPTSLGQSTAAAMSPILEQLNTALADLHRQARGQQAELRVGYIGSASETYLNPALHSLRKEHPESKVKLLDLSPAEQIRDLQAGRIDIALIGQEGEPLSHDFYTRKLATLGVCVALPYDHPLASRKTLHPDDLKGEAFIGAPETDVPGRNRWITKICKSARFKPKFVGDASSIGELFSMIASEGAISLLPAYFAREQLSGAQLIPLIDPSAKWDLLLVWQRGRPSKVLSCLVKHLVCLAKSHSEHPRDRVRRSPKTVTAKSPA